MEQQLSILDLLDVTSDKEEVDVWFTEADSKGNTLIHDVIIDDVLAKGIIKNSFTKTLGKHEVIELYGKASNHTKGKYGYKALIEIDNKYYEIYFRMFNTSTSGTETVFEFIDKKWDLYFRQLKESRKNVKTQFKRFK